MGGSATRPAGHTIGVAEAAAGGLDLAAPAAVEDEPVEEETPSLELDVDDWDLEQDWTELIDLPQPQPTATALPAWPPSPGYGSSAPPWMQAPPASMPAAYPATAFGAPAFFPTAVPPTVNVPATPVRRTGGVAWFIVSLGLTALVCGVALLLGSTLTGRGALWTVGLPIAVSGQVVLLLGLALQLERIGQGSRKAAVKLDHVDEQLHNLQQATTMLGTTHSSASQAFYAHLAEGANPQMLLADVKSQLDLLAMRMSQRNR
jgi:hypothetical protein